MERRSSGRRAEPHSVTLARLGYFAGFALAACSSNAPGEQVAMGGSGGAASSMGGSGGGQPLPGECNAVIVESVPTSARHLEECSAIEYSTNPPSGGNHYDVWAAFQTYDFPVPPGFLVHALEHGAVVFWYDCPEGCDDEVAEAQAFIDARPADVSCAGRGAERRAILTPSPTLGANWAASAWGFALTADCFDAGVFEDFYADHYGRGPEDLCAPGQAFTADPCL